MKYKKSSSDKKSPIAQNVCRKNHSINATKLNKQVSNKQKLNIREATEMFKNKNVLN